MLTKEQQALVTDLFSTKDSTVIKALEELRTLGNENTLEPIIQTLVDTKSEVVRTEIVRYLNELKSAKATAPLFKAILSPKYHVFQAELVAALWESGLDCNAYITPLVELAINEDYLVAIEALTVIENTNPPYNQEELSKLIVKVDSAILLADDLKTPLLANLKELLLSF